MCVCVCGEWGGGGGGRSRKGGGGGEGVGRGGQTNERGMVVEDTEPVKWGEGGKQKSTSQLKQFTCVLHIE